MGTHVFALVAEWPPAVAAYRAAGGLDFYRDANAAQDDRLEAARLAGHPVALDAIPPVLPFADERDLCSGRGYVHAGWYYEFLRARLPDPLRVPADAFLGLLYPGVGDLPDHPDDLSTDAGRPADHTVLYALRPATVHTALDRAAALPWDDFTEVGARIEVPEMADDSHVPDLDTFCSIVWEQRDWLRRAARSGRGLIAVISQ